MKKRIGMILISMMALLLTACSKTPSDVSPDNAQITRICKLATLKCYYHNVAKYYEKDADSIFLGIGSKDRKFWIEYSGIVEYGIDASLVHADVKEENVTITIPPAKVLSCQVDEKTLNKDSFIIAKDSANVKAEHQTEAVKQAQENLENEAKDDQDLLANAQQRAQKLLEDYVNNIGQAVGKTYKITWEYLEGAEELSNLDTDQDTDKDTNQDTDENTSEDSSEDTTEN